MHEKPTSVYCVPIFMRASNGCRCGALGDYYQKEPFTAFALLTPDAQAYFLPAFIRMCEREPEMFEGLGRSLLGYLTSAAKPSSELRSRLTERQKAGIAAFFNEAPR